MATTKLANLINPEVMAQMISEAVKGKLNFLPLAEVDTTLQGVPGNTLTVPKYQYIGDATEVAEGGAIDLTLLQAGSTQVTVKKAAKGVEITDEALLSGYGDPVGEANGQLEKSILRKVDNDIFTTLADATVTRDLSTQTIGSGAIADALVAFGEDVEGAKVMPIHAEQLATVRKDPDFIKVNELQEKYMNGVVGEIWGVQLFVSNKVEKDSVAGTFTNYVVKPGAIGLLLKRDVEVETDRDITTKTNVITADQHYATYLKDDSKVIKVTFKA